jgi:hypothetical protein
MAVVGDWFGAKPKVYVTPVWAAWAEEISTERLVTWLAVAVWLMSISGTVATVMATTRKRTLFILSMPWRIGSDRRSIMLVFPFIFYG